jgi:hypothetical protein
VAHHRHLALQLIQALDVVALLALGEDQLLDFFQLRLQHIEHREVAVHHRVHQRVQHERRAEAQHVRLLLARAHAEEALLRLAVRDDST